MAAWLYEQTIRLVKIELISLKSHPGIKQPLMADQGPTCSLIKKSGIYNSDICFKQRGHKAITQDVYTNV